MDSIQSVQMLFIFKSFFSHYCIYFLYLNVLFFRQIGIFYANIDQEGPKWPQIIKAVGKDQIKDICLLENGYREGKRKFDGKGGGKEEWPMF